MKLNRGAAKLSVATMRQARPVRNPLVTESHENGVLILRGPAQLRGLLGRWLAKSSSETPMKQYELEEVGAFVWSLIDGKRTVGVMAKQLQDRFKMNRMEAEASLNAFLKMLADRGLITMLVKQK